MLVVWKERGLWRKRGRGQARLWLIHAQEVATKTVVEATGADFIIAVVKLVVNAADKGKGAVEVRVGRMRVVGGRSGRARQRKGGGRKAN